MATVRQAVILARGLGTRMQRTDGSVTLKPEAEAVAARGVKALVPINGRPFLDYTYSTLRRAGFERVVLVVAPEADELRTHARGLAAAMGDMEIDFAVQQTALGTADAVHAGEGATGAEPFIVLNGDNLYPVETLAQMQAESDGSAVGIFSRDDLVRLSNIDPARIDRFGIVVPGADGMLERIVEKPPQPEQYRVGGQLWLNMNMFRFSPRIYEACRRIEPNPLRGEYEITTAIQFLKDELGEPIRTVRTSGLAYDLTSRRDIPRLETMLAGFEFAF